MACTLAESPRATLCIESSDSFVASAAVSIATGWSEPVPGRELHPLKSSAFSRRTFSHPIRAFRAKLNSFPPADCRIIKNHEGQEAPSQTSASCTLPHVWRGTWPEVRTQLGTVSYRAASGPALDGGGLNTADGTSVNDRSWRWVVNLRRWICNLLTFLRIHTPDCEHCNPGGRQGGEDMRKRLEELR